VFVAQKAANELMGPITFVSARFVLSALTILPLVLWETKRSPAPLKWQQVWLAGLIGACLFIGSSLQQIGLLTTTVSNGGFLTALYVVLVPFTTWFLTREKIRKSVLLASVVAVAGAWLLSAHGRLDSIARGDIIILVSDVAWAFWISLIAIFLKHVPRPFFLAFAQFAVTAVMAGILAAFLEPWSWDDIKAAMFVLLYAGIISGGIAFTLQIVAQRYTPAPEAAVIMSLESVVAVAAGAALLGERLIPIAIVGCVLILIGVLIAEIGPALKRS